MLHNNIDTKCEVSGFQSSGSLDSNIIGCDSIQSRKYSATIIPWRWRHQAPHKHRLTAYMATRCSNLDYKLRYLKT
jgi:hypothetical protein